jgi:hypothetical protein
LKGRRSEGVTAPVNVLYRTAEGIANQFAVEMRFILQLMKQPEKQRCFLLFLLPNVCETAIISPSFL